MVCVCCCGRGTFSNFGADGTRRRRKKRGEKLLGSLQFLVFFSETEGLEKKNREVMNHARLGRQNKQTRQNRNFLRVQKESRSHNKQLKVGNQLEKLGARTSLEPGCEEEEAPRDASSILSQYFPVIASSRDARRLKSVQGPNTSSSVDMSDRLPRIRALKRATKKKESEGE